MALLGRCMTSRHCPEVTMYLSIIFLKKYWFKITNPLLFNASDEDCSASKFRHDAQLKTIRKRGNCKCIATWGRPRHASTCLRRHAKFEVAKPIHCRIIAFLLLIHYFTLWPWPLTFALEHLQCIACDIIKLFTKFGRNRAICDRVIAILVFDLMTLNIALRVALGCGIIFTKFWPLASWP